MRGEEAGRKSWLRGKQHGMGKKETEVGSRVTLSFNATSTESRRSTDQPCLPSTCTHPRTHARTHPRAPPPHTHIHTHSGHDWPLAHGHNQLLPLTHTTLHKVQYVHALLTEEEVLVLPMVGHFPPPLLAPLDRYHVPEEKHVGYCDVRVLQVLQWVGMEVVKGRIRDMHVVKMMQFQCSQCVIKLLDGWRVP